ncbi:CoA transferase [Paralcaligenes sp. KSB-10]|uniref:CaiB/BaiF CoA transferase family protein n=1 Tax=Paralcaligenes sp. KSB-10 TaxID=2901142 RepID=UPI001E628197|nr:CaiB/BaiF CoA-transferase family protein [Paralcaligenes sp. KSB-10]UHL64541.1 CoA transferase [Paralcaligenes sp. KSB-10]
MPEMTCLSDTVVLDLGQLHPGPHTAMLLGQLGATVIKVERRAGGDPARALGADTFAKYNRGKLSIALDLKNPDDRVTLLRLVRHSHALIEGFRPGVMDRLGLSYSELRGANPALVMCSISGFGQTGPYAQRPAHDLNFLALAGYWAVPSQVDDLIGRPHVRLSDYCASMYAALAMVVALMTARQEGCGQYLDVSIHDAMMAWTAPGIDILRRATSDDIDGMAHIMPDNDLFATSDGRYVALGILEEKFWVNLRERLRAEFPEIGSQVYDTRAERMRRKRELHTLLKGIFVSKTLAQWKQVFHGSDIPWAPVLDREEVFADPHVLDRGLLSAAPDGGGMMAGFPVRFSSGLPERSMSVPELDGSRRAIMDWLDSKDGKH